MSFVAVGGNSWPPGWINVTTGVPADESWSVVPSGCRWVACRMIEFADATDRCLLIVDVDEVVGLASDDERRLRGSWRFGWPGEPGHRGDGRKDVWSIRPQAIDERPAVGKAGRIDAALIDAVLLAERGEHRIEEFEIAVVDWPL